jgi:Tol biopolymer transport system component
MSPEQASGRPVDYRSDQFALGSILYEMATGQRAFQKPTGAETLSAIIREEPEPVARVNPRAPAPYRWIVDRCLAKDPEDRYASTRDLARDLKSVREHVSEVTSSASGSTAVSAAPAKRRTIAWWIAAAALALGLAGGLLLDRRMSKTQPPSFKQLTFRRGDIRSARFSPDGQTILFTAAWDGSPVEIYSRRLESPESRALGLPGAELLAVSRSGEMALAVGRKPLDPFRRTGRLASMTIAGGVAPREILDDVQVADWSPDGKEFAVVRDVGGRTRLEFPIGKPLFETSGWISQVRISPAGDSVAFCHHPAAGDDGGEIMVADRSGKTRKLAGDYSTVQGIAWNPRGGEIWFTAAPEGSNRGLYAVSPAGKVRLVARVTGAMFLHDIAPDGRVLLAHETSRQGIMGHGPREDRERSLGWLDFPSGRDLSPDGSLLLFDETGEGGGPGYSVYIRKTDGSPATRLGDGAAGAFSPDLKWALCVRNLSSNPEMVLYPTSVGEPRALPVPGLRVQTADWLPDGKSIVVTANEPGHGPRLFVVDLAGLKAKAISPEGYRFTRHAISPDGRLAVVSGPDQRYYLYPLAGGEPQAIADLVPQDRVESWTGDGKNIVVHRRGELPVRVYLMDPVTGKRSLWKELMPLDTAGLGDIGGVMVGKDGKSYAYGAGWILSDLFLVEGLK